MIRIDQESFRCNLRVVYVNLAPLRIVHFIISGSSLRVDYAEVGFHTTRLLHLVEQQLKIPKRLTTSQSLIHHDTFLIFNLGRFAL